MEMVLKIWYMFYKFCDVISIYLIFGYTLFNEKLSNVNSIEN